MIDRQTISKRFRSVRFFIAAYVIRKRVSPKFIDRCMETPGCCSSEGHKRGGRKGTETSVTETSVNKKWSKT